MSDDLLQHMRDCDAILEGHWIYSSGRHGPEYYQCALALAQTGETWLFDAMQQMTDLIDEDESIDPDYIIGPAVGAINLAWAVGYYMEIPNIFAERDKDKKFTLRRGFEIEEGKSYLIVEDVTTTGGSVREIMALIEEGGGRVCGVACMIDRSNGTIDFGVSHIALKRVEAISYAPDECPICKEGKAEAVAPGSKQSK